MSRYQLVDGFMRLSSQSKVEEPISPTYHRQRAGRKGIGRFATQRLGRTLTITTQTAVESIAREVTIDWDQFEPNQDLTLL